MTTENCHEIGDVLLGWAFLRLGTSEFTVTATPDESRPETIRNSEAFRQLLLDAVEMGRKMAQGRPTIIDVDLTEAHELAVARQNSGGF